MSDKKSSSNATGTSLATFYGVKAGMTRIFDKAGNHVPVTVIKLIPNVISQVKTKENDGYEAYQVSYNEKREKLVTKALKGHLKKATIEASLSEASEIKVEGVSADLLGQALTYDNFQADTYVDVTGLSKGKGTQGVMKRYNFRGGPATHGSHFHRRPGSIGNRATPARVFPEKKMPGRMGVENVTTQNLKIVEVNIENGYMLIKGSVPGSKNGYVKVARATKKA